MNKLHSIISVLVLLTILLITILVINKQYETVDNTYFLKSTKCFVINLKDDTERMIKYKKYYESSDMVKLPYQRFEGIYGKDVDLEKYVSDSGIQDINNAKELNYRTKHYQLTVGAVGCYLSHLSLYQKLLEDPAHEYYLIFEDDVKFNDDLLSKIVYYENYAPEDWDLLIFGAIREFGSNLFSYIEYEYFWGLNCYLINKKGAQKMMDEYYQKKIDMQLDSAMDLMIYENRLKVYGSLRKLTKHEYEKSNIQIPVIQQIGINPYDLNKN